MDKQYNKMVIFPLRVATYEQTQILKSMKVFLVCFVIQAKHEKNMDDGVPRLG
jgi:hypothetical protein